MRSIKAARGMLVFRPNARRARSLLLVFLGLAACKDVGDSIRISGGLDASRHDSPSDVDCMLVHPTSRNVRVAGSLGGQEAILVASCTVGWSTSAISFGKIRRHESENGEGAELISAGDPYLIRHKGTYQVGDWMFLGEGGELESTGVGCFLGDKDEVQEEAWTFDGNGPPVQLSDPFSDFPEDYAPVRVCGMTDRPSGEERLAAIGFRRGGDEASEVALFAKSESDWRKILTVPGDGSIKGGGEVDLRMGWSGSAPRAVGVISTTNGTKGKVFVWDWAEGIVFERSIGVSTVLKGLAPRVVMPYLDNTLSPEMASRFVVFGGVKRNDPSLNWQYIAHRTWTMRYGVLDLGGVTKFEPRTMTSREVDTSSIWEGRQCVDSLLLWRDAAAGNNEIGIVFDRGMMVAVPFSIRISAPLGTTARVDNCMTSDLRQFLGGHGVAFGIGSDSALVLGPSQYWYPVTHEGKEEQLTQVTIDADGGNFEVEELNLDSLVGDSGILVK